MSRRASLVSWRHLPLALLLGCSTITPEGPLAQFCPSTQSSGAGNIDRPSGVAVAVQGDNAYAVVANPDVQVARAVNLAEGLMVPAPNKYFPMAVKLGTYTEFVGASDDGLVAVALDASDQELRFFRVGPVSDKNTWRRVGDKVKVDDFPTGLAVRGTSEDLVVLVSHAASLNDAGMPSGSLSILRWGATDGLKATQRLELDGRPSSVSMVQDGSVAVIGNARDGRLWVVEPLTLTDPLPVPPFPACAAGVARPCTVDVGGPAVGVSAAAVNLLGLAAAAVRVDIPAVAVLRLRNSSPEDPPVDADRLEGTVYTPRPPVVVALAPKGAPSLSAVSDQTNQYFEVFPSALNGGGFAYGVVAQLDGSLVYLDLSAEDALGRRTPRLVDKNGAAPGPMDDTTGEPLDVNTATTTYQEVGLELGVAADPARRPRVSIEVASDVTGTPPVVLQEITDDYVFIYEGVLPGASGRTGHTDATALQDGTVEDARAGFELSAVGVRAGDLLEIRKDDGPCTCPEDAPECTSVALLSIQSVQGNRMQVAPLPADPACLLQERGFTYSVRAAKDFVVLGLLTVTDFGRAGFLQPIPLPGIRVTLLPGNFTGEIPGEVLSREGSTGTTPVTAVPILPPPRDARVIIPLRSNFAPFRIGLDDTNPDLGRIIQAGSVPTGLVIKQAPLPVGTATTATRVPRYAGFLSTGGGGLVLQFWLGFDPTNSDGSLSRSNVDIRFRFFE